MLRRACVIDSCKGSELTSLGLVDEIFKGLLNKSLGLSLARTVVFATVTEILNNKLETAHTHCREESLYLREKSLRLCSRDG